MIPMDLVGGYVADLFKQFWPHTAFVIGLILATEYASQIKGLFKG